MLLNLLDKASLKEVKPTTKVVTMMPAMIAYSNAVTARLVIINSQRNTPIEFHRCATPFRNCDAIICRVTKGFQLEPPVMTN